MKTGAMQTRAGGGMKGTESCCLRSGRKGSSMFLLARQEAIWYFFSKMALQGNNDGGTKPVKVQYERK